MMSDKGLLFIVSGASATGKDTVISQVMKNYGSKSKLSVSMTTREPRGSEKDGEDYFFVSTEQFEKNILENKMLEYAKYGENYYGTPAEPVKKWLDEGKIVFLIIEVQGAAIVRANFPQAKSIFILPPSMKALEERLRKRGTEDEEAIKMRLQIASCEIRRAEEYDYIVVNDRLSTAVKDVSAICQYEYKLENDLTVEEEIALLAEKYNKKNLKNIISEVIFNA